MKTRSKLKAKMLKITKHQIETADCEFEEPVLSFSWSVDYGDEVISVHETRLAAEKKYDRLRLKFSMSKKD